MFCAERAGAPAGRAGPGSGSVHRRWGLSRSRGWGRSHSGSLRARGELFPWSGGVPLRWVAAFPAQRGLSVGSGPAQPGARLPSACTTVVGRYLHRRCGFHCCRRHIASEGHFRVPAHIITDRAPPHVCVTLATAPPRCRAHHPKDVPSAPHTSGVPPELSPPVSHCRGHGEPPFRRRFDVDHPRAAAQRRLSEKVGAAGARPYGVICPIWVCPRGPFSGDISAHLFGPGRLV